MAKKNEKDVKVDKKVSKKTQPGVDENKNSKRRVAVMAGAAGAFLVVAIGLAVALPKLLADDVEPSTGAPTNQAGVAGAAASNPAAGAPQSDPAPAGAPQEIPAGPLKDPFNALVKGAPGAAEANLASIPIPPVAPVMPVAPVGVPVVPVAGPIVPAPAPVAAAPAAPGPQRVMLLDAYFDSAGGLRAAIKVGDAIHSVGVGETFAQVYKLESVNSGCAEISRGTDKFTLCQGQEITK